MGQALPFGLVCLFWGVNYSFVVVGLGYAPPLWLAFLRVVFGVAGSILVLPFISRWVGPASPLDRRGRLRAMLLGVPNSALMYTFWFVAAPYVPVGQVSVLVYTYPLWVLFLASPVLGERPTLRQVGASVVGFAGITVIGLSKALLWSGAVVPVLELLLAAISWAVATVFFKRWFRREEMLEANLWQLLGATPVLLALAWWQAPVSSVHLTLTLVLVLLWIGVLGTAIAYGIWFLLLARHKASTLASYLFVVPIVALVSGYVLLGQAPSEVEVLGIVAVLVSIYLSAQGERRSSPRVDRAGPSVEGAS